MSLHARTCARGTWEPGRLSHHPRPPPRRHGADRVVIDDLEVRRCAKAMGLRIIGTLGVVGRAKAMGKIAQAAPVIAHRHRTGLYVSDDLVQHLLRQVGE